MKLPTPNATNRGDLTERLIRILFLLAERPHSQRELARIFNLSPPIPGLRFQLVPPNKDLVC